MEPTSKEDMDRLEEQMHAQWTAETFLMGNLITPAMRRRILATYCRMGRDRCTFYIRESAGLLMTWAGGGLKPAWVQQWLDKGGSLADLAVTITKDAKQ